MGAQDLEEVRLAEMSALRVTPLVANPGRFLLTHQRLYFQPLNNVDANPVEVLITDRGN
jgi:hypothetical protein